MIDFRKESQATLKTAEEGAESATLETGQSAKLTSHASKSTTYEVPLKRRNTCLMCGRLAFEDGGLAESDLARLPQARTRAEDFSSSEPK